MPDINQKIQTVNGIGSVLDMNVIGQKVKVRYVDNGGVEWVALDQVSIIEG
jgi:hypothetical protein